MDFRSALDVHYPRVLAQKLHTMQVVEETVADDDVLMIKGCKSSRAVTVLLRGANDYLLDEMDRSLHDAFCIVKRVLESGSVVPGACPCCLTENELKCSSAASYNAMNLHSVSREQDHASRGAWYIEQLVDRGLAAQSGRLAGIGRTSRQGRGGRSDGD